MGVTAVTVAMAGTIDLGNNTDTGENFLGRGQITVNGGEADDGGHGGYGGANAEADGGDGAIALGYGGRGRFFGGGGAYGGRSNDDITIATDFNEIEGSKNVLLADNASDNSGGDGGALRVSAYGQGGSGGTATATGTGGIGGYGGDGGGDSDDAGGVSLNGGSRVGQDLSGYGRYRRFHQLLRKF